MASMEQSSSPPKIEAASSIQLLYLSWTLTSLISTSPTFVFQLPLSDFLLKLDDDVKSIFYKLSTHMRALYVEPNLKMCRSQ